ncbi:MAG: TonB-dependent receptor [Bacteroidales bacterium]|nr:TonB-dependent receptor [Bacteroidales bacterium]
MAGTIYSQTALLSLNCENVTVYEVLKSMESESEYYFLYSPKMINVDRTVSVKAENKGISSILDQIFTGTNVKYLVKDRQIVLSTEERLSMFSLPVQPVRVTGKVTDKDGEPIIGANISVKGTNEGTITDIDGSYEIKAPPDAVLVFSFIGMEAREVLIDGRQNIDVVLSDDLKELEEVIVVGYGTMKKSDVNAAISSVNADELLTVSSSEITSLLTGRAAGVTVLQGSAQPGGASRVLVRGAASTGAGNDPLYVIDGFPVVSTAVKPGSGTQFNAGSHSPLSDINPNDIESIEVLKDASATAIYGARGSNGVILITTKRGSEGTSVEYTMNTSVQQIINRPVLLNGQEFMVEQNNYLYERYLMLNQLPPYGNRDSFRDFVPAHSEEEIANAGKGTDWYDMVTQTGRINQHNLSIASGNDVTKTLFSLNYYNHEGVLKTSGLERYGIRFNMDQKITDWWDYGISSSATYVSEKNATLGNGRDATAGIIESAMNYSPLIPAERGPDGAWIEDPEQALLNHPLSYLDIIDNTANKRYLVNLFTNMHFTDNLWLKLSGGFDIRNGLRQNYYPQTTRYGRQVEGDANINGAFREDYLTDAVLNYQKEVKDHNIIALVGYSYQNLNGNGVSARAQQFSSDALTYHALNAGEQIPIVGSYTNKHILASYFTRLQYAYTNKYIFTFSARVDGSDRFGENNRYAFFPSGAFAWRMSQEEFIRNIDWISNLKLRLSLGQVGNENIANDAASEYYAFQGRNYPFGESVDRGVNLAKIGNPDLRWETTTEMNVGVDYGFFKNRINGSLEVFYKQIEDLLSNRQLPYSSIVGSIPWNVGKTQSKGIELTLNTINTTGPLKWESVLTFTSYHDRWLERDPKVILMPYQGAEDPIRAVFTLIPDGIKQPGEETPSQPNLLIGQQKFKDVNGLDEEGNLTGEPDGRINQADAVFQGITDPKFTAGLYNTFAYGNFDLNVFLYASYGALKWPNTRIEHSVYGSYGVQQLDDNYNYLKEIQNRWSSQNMDTEMPSGEVNSSSFYGAPYFDDASYLRLRDLSLGYNLAGLTNTRIHTARVYLSAQNLFTLTNYSGMDPEAEPYRASYPQQRTFSMGVDIKF